MKNKALLAIIVVITTLTVTAWADSPPIIVDITEQTEAGKTAPAEVPAEPQHLASKPDTVTMTTAELKAYENNIIDRAEKFYTVSISSLFSIATILATLFGIFIVVLVAYLPYLKWRYEKNVEKQIDKQSAEFQDKVKKAHDAIKAQGKEMRQLFNGLKDDVERHIYGLNKRIYREQAARQIETGEWKLGLQDYNASFMSYLYAAGDYLAAKEFGLAYTWLVAALDVGKRSHICFFDFQINSIAARLVYTKTLLTEPDQIARFTPMLSEISAFIDEQEKHAVATKPNATDPIESEPDKTETPD